MIQSTTEQAGLVCDHRSTESAEMTSYGENLLALADELEHARNDHLQSFGSSPSIVRRTRNKLRQLLWDDKSTIIAALRSAAKLEEKCTGS